jgi:hypothetical protein
MPQIVMLNHAAWVNGKRMERRTGTGSKEDSEIVYNGKRLEELNSDELTAYYGDWS